MRTRRREGKICNTPFILSYFSWIPFVTENYGNAACHCNYVNPQLNGLELQRERDGDTATSCQQGCCADMDLTEVFYLTAAEPQ